MQKYCSSLYYTVRKFTYCLKLEKVKSNRSTNNWYKVKTEVDPPSIFSQREDCQNQSSLQDQQVHDHQNAGEEQEEVITLEGTDGREPEMEGEEGIFQEDGRSGDGRMKSKNKRGSSRGTITLGGLK